MSEKYSVITGGTGYVGLALVKYLVSRGERVRLLLLEDHPCLDGIDCEEGHPRHDGEDAAHEVQGLHRQAAHDAGAAARQGRGHRLQGDRALKHERTHGGPPGAGLFLCPRAG